MEKQDGLIAKAAALQVARGLTDREMAQRMGIDRSMWTFLRNGRAQPGRKTLQGLLAGFPELTTDVLLFLRGR